MKMTRILVLGALGVMLAGCGTLEVNPGGNPDRVLTGTVNPGTGLPAGAEVTVRLLASSTREDTATRPAGADIPVLNRPGMPNVERVLGEHSQTLTAGTAEPVPFRIQYYADDGLLRRGVNVEARVSFGGKLRYRTISAHMVTLGSSPFPQDVQVQPVQ